MSWETGGLSCCRVFCHRNQIWRSWTCTGATGITKSVLACKNLKKLDLNANYIPNDCVDEIVAAMKQAHPEVVCEFDENDEDMVDDDTDPQELQAYSEGFDEELARSFEKL